MHSAAVKAILGDWATTAVAGSGATGGPFVPRFRLADKAVLTAIPHVSSMTLHQAAVFYKEIL